MRSLDRDSDENELKAVSLMGQSQTKSSVDLKNRSLAAFLALLMPGLGHLYQGRTGKAILYTLAILGLYFIGFALGEGSNVYWSWVNPMRDPEHFRLYYLGQFWVGLPSWPALLQATLVQQGQVPLFNGFMAAPRLDPEMPGAVQETMLEVFIRARSIPIRLGQLREVGDIYTTIAGLLNILAIYDAYDGPAFQNEPETGAKTTASDAPTSNDRKNNPLPETA